MRARRAEKAAEADVPAATDTVIGVGSERDAPQFSGAPQSCIQQRHWRRNRTVS